MRLGTIYRVCIIIALLGPALGLADGNPAPPPAGGPGKHTPDKASPSGPAAADPAANRAEDDSRKLEALATALGTKAADLGPRVSAYKSGMSDAGGDKRVQFDVASQFLEALGDPSKLKASDLETFGLSKEQAAQLELIRDGSKLSTREVQNLLDDPSALSKLPPGMADVYKARLAREADGELAKLVRGLAQGEDAIVGLSDRSILTFLGAMRDSKDPKAQAYGIGEFIKAVPQQKRKELADKIAAMDGSKLRPAEQQASALLQAGLTRKGNEIPEIPAGSSYKGDFKAVFNQVDANRAAVRQQDEKYAALLANEDTAKRTSAENHFASNYGSTAIPWSRVMSRWGTEEEKTTATNFLKQFDRDGYLGVTGNTGSINGLDLKDGPVYLRGPDALNRVSAAASTPGQNLRLTFEQPKTFADAQTRIETTRNIFMASGQGRPTAELTQEFNENVNIFRRDEKFKRAIGVDANQQVARLGGSADDGTNRFGTWERQIASRWLGYEVNPPAKASPPSPEASKAPSSAPAPASRQDTPSAPDGTPLYVYEVPAGEKPPKGAVPTIEDSPVGPSAAPAPAPAPAPGPAPAPAASSPMPASVIPLPDGSLFAEPEPTVKRVVEETTKTRKAPDGTEEVLRTRRSIEVSPASAPAQALFEGMRLGGSGRLRPGAPVSP